MGVRRAGDKRGPAWPARPGVPWRWRWRRQNGPRGPAAAWPRYSCVPGNSGAERNTVAHVVAEQEFHGGAADLLDLGRLRLDLHAVDDLHARTMGSSGRSSGPSLADQARGGRRAAVAAETDRGNVDPELAGGRQYCGALRTELSGRLRWRSLSFDQLAAVWAEAGGAGADAVLGLEAGGVGRGLEGDAPGCCGAYLLAHLA